LTSGLQNGDSYYLSVDLYSQVSLYMSYIFRIELHFFCFNLLWVLSQGVLFWACWTLYQGRRRPGLRAIDVLWWWALVGWVGFIYMTLSVMRTITNNLRDALGESAFNLGIVVVLAVIALSIAGYIIYALASGRLGPKRLPALLLWFVVAGVVFLYLGHIPIERIHLAQYGLVGVLGWRGLRPFLKGNSLLIGAILLSAAFGSLDEVTQEFLPMRVFDYRDIAVNAIAATAGIGIIKTLSSQEGSDEGEND